VMDTTAVVLCRDHGVPIRVVDISRRNVMMRVITGEGEGTLIDAGA